MNAFIKANIDPGMFSSERIVSFQTSGKRYNLFVDYQDITNGKLMVQVISRGKNKSYVALPRETVTTGSQIFVDNKDLIEE